MDSTINSVDERGDTYIYHYGVKGMKWGVRRDIGKKARAAAAYEIRSDKMARKASKLRRKFEKNGYLSDKDALHYRRYADSSAIYRFNRASMMRGLSKKDIARGRRAIAAMRIMTFPYTLAMDDYHFTIARGERVLEREQSMAEAEAQNKKRRRRSHGRNQNGRE